MNRKTFNIIYLVIMVIIIALFVFIKDFDVTLQFIFGSVAIILTSIFTYSNRRKS